MTSKIDTAYQLRKVANFFQGLVQAADDIEAIGILENATREARDAQKAAAGQRDAAEAELAAARESIKFETDKAKVECAEMRAKAKAAAEKVTADKLEVATSKASSIVDQAIQEAQKVTATMEKARQAAQAQLNALLVESAEIMSENTRAAQELQSTRADHDTLAKALADLKSRIGA